MRLQSSATLIGVLAAAGCSSTSSKTTSTLDGTAALATFPTSPVSAVATDESGHAVAAPVGADGHFSFTLTKGHHYAVSFPGTAGDIPVVWPRASGKLNTAFRLSTGGARLDIGSVRYFASAPEGGFHVSVGAPVTSTGGPNEECVDGVLAGTTTPCVDDDGKTTCDDGQEVGDGDGECENGVDARTGAACTDPPESTSVADPATAMAVPDRSVPDDVSGCSEEGNDGETNDD